VPLAESLRPSLVSLGSKTSRASISLPSTNPSRAISPRLSLAIPSPRIPRSPSEAVTFCLVLFSQLGMICRFFFFPFALERSSPRRGIRASETVFPLHNFFFVDSPFQQDRGLLLKHLPSLETITPPFTEISIGHVPSVNCDFPSTPHCFLRRAVHCCLRGLRAPALSFFQKF